MRNLVRRTYDDAVMPEENFKALSGELSESFMEHVSNAEKIETARLKGRTVDRLYVETRLRAIRAEVRQEIAALLMAYPERLMMTDAFTAESFAFLYETGRELVEKRERLAQLKGGNVDEK